jgi:hypothetical protein
MFENLDFRMLVLVRSKTVGQAYSVSGSRATSGPLYVADWPDSCIYSCLIQFPVVFSDLAFRYLLQYN